MNTKTMKILIKALYKNNKNQNISNNKIIEILITLAVFLSIIFLVLLIEFNIYNFLNKYNLENIILNMAILSTIFFTFIITVPKVFKELNNSNEFNSLIVLPIKEFELLIVKFIFILKNPLIISSIIFLTTTFIYGFFKEKNIVYYCLSIIGTITIPTIITMIVIIIMIIFMKIINKNNISKFKSILNLIPLFSSILFLIAIKFIDLKDLLITIKYNKFYSFLETIIGNKFIILGLINLKYQYLSIFIIIIILIIYLFLIYLVSKYYRLVVSKNSEISNKVKFKQVHKNNQLLSLIKKDFKVLIRDPFYFVNIFLKTFVTPLTLTLLLLLNNEFEINMLLGKVNITILQILLIIVFIESKMNFISATAITRDKNEMTILSTFPIKNLNLILSKVILGFAINLILILITIIIFNIKFYINLIDLIIILFISIILCIYGSLKAFLLNLENNKLYLNSIITILIIGTIFESIIFILIIWKLGIISAAFIFGVLGSIYTCYRIRRYTKNYLF